MACATRRGFASAFFVFFTAFGSVWYHLAPSDHTLIWDRLPMTVVFMALLSIVIGGRFLVPLLALGGASVFWWVFTGDLRPYAVVQFGAALVVLPSLWPVVAAYGAAKLAERYDGPIYSVLPWSGHTLKHLIAAAACYFILRGHGLQCKARPQP